MSKRRFVLITTQHKGVFAGRLVRTADAGRTVVLSDARCAIYWSTKKGFLELASDGPNKSSCIGSKAQKITLYDVTSIADCAPAAVKAWESC